MNRTNTIVLKCTDGDYIADYMTASADARNHTHRQLVARVADYWPELWGSSERGALYPLNDESREWRRWIRSMGKLELAVILNQK